MRYSQQTSHRFDGSFRRVLSLPVAVPRKNHGFGDCADQQNDNPDSQGIKSLK